MVDAVSYLVSVVSLVFIRKEFQEQRREEREGLHREIAEGLVWLWRQPFLRATAGLVAGSNFIFQAMVLVLIVLAQDRDASPALVGVILGLMGGGGLLGAVVAPWANRHVPPKAVVIGVNWVWAALLPLVAVVPWPLALGVIAGAMAFVGPAWNVVIGSYALTLTPDRLRGRVSGVEGLIAWGPIPFGSLVGGLLLERLGGVEAALVMAVAMLAIALAASLSPAVRHAPPLVREAPDVA